MKHPIIPQTIFPKPAEIAREAIVVIAGALLAAYVVGKLPTVRDWIRAQWDNKPPEPI